MWAYTIQQRAKVTLTDATYQRFSASGSPSGVRYTPAGIKEAQDDLLGGATWTQDDAATDWIIPNSAAPGSYEIRCTQNSGDTLDLGSDALNTWLALTSTRTWQLTNSINGTTETANLTIEIRLGTTVLDSCTIVLETENT